MVLSTLTFIDHYKSTWDHLQILVVHHIYIHYLTLAKRIGFIKTTSIRSSSWFSKLTLRIFLIVCMKWGDHKGRKVTEPKFSEKLVWPKFGDLLYSSAPNLGTCIHFIYTCFICGVPQGSVNGPKYINIYWTLQKYLGPFTDPCGTPHILTPCEADWVL